MTAEKNDGAQDWEAELAPVMDELNAAAAAARKKGLYISLSVLGAALLLDALLYAVQIVDLEIGAFLLVLGAAGAVFAYSRCVAFVRRRYKDTVIPVLLHALDPGLTYSRTSFIAKETFKNSELYQSRIDRYSGEDLVSGTYRGVPLMFSEVKAEEKHTTSDGKTTQTHYETVFDGVFLIADFKKDFHSRHWVLPDAAEGVFGQMFGNFLQKMNFTRSGRMTRMEDPEFEKKFAVYTEDEVEARYILSPKMMRRMLDLSRRYNGKTAFAFLNSNVYAAIPLKKNLLEMPDGSLSMDSVRATMGELCWILALFDELELDVRIWSKE